MSSTEYLYFQIICRFFNANSLLGHISLFGQAIVKSLCFSLCPLEGATLSPIIQMLLPSILYTWVAA